ncbi:MAG: dihydrofolate reductase [Halioglobus sp.]
MTRTPILPRRWRSDDSMVELAVIVAAADNGVIGCNGALPWHLPEDLRYFKRVTLGKPIVMGRKTYESIGKPLPGRTNIVVSRNTQYRAEGVRVVASLDDALQLAETIAEKDSIGELMVIGGAQIYAEALVRADRLYYTAVHCSADGDAFLPEIDWALWRETSREAHPAKTPDETGYTFLTYDRHRPKAE